MLPERAIAQAVDPHDDPSAADVFRHAASRWWTFEDGRTNFGEIRPDTTDLAKLLFIEFGLVYSNDWFIVPHTLEGGSIAAVAGLAVTSVFGDRLWVEAAGRGLDDDWQRWSMFTVSVRGEDQSAADTSLLFLPVVPKVQEGAARRDRADARRDGEHGLGHREDHRRAGRARQVRRSRSP